MKKVALILALVTGTQPVRGQNAANFGARYAQGTEYRIRPGIMMIPSYGSDGQVCKVLIERHSEVTASETTVELGRPISDELARALVDEIVPPAERGAEVKDPDGFIDATVAGGVVTARCVYKNVIVRVYGDARSDPMSNLVLTITWR